MKNVTCGMWLVSANANFDGYVANLLLHKLGNGFGLVVKVGLTGG